MHSIFELGMRQEWCVVKPCQARRPPDRQRAAKAETDIRSWARTSSRSSIAAPYPDDAWGSIEPTLFLTAAMSGLRQGELLALRWRDVDFDARRIRVVQNYVRGQFDTPEVRQVQHGRCRWPQKVAQALLRLQGPHGLRAARTTSCSATPTPEARLTAPS